MPQKEKLETPHEYLARMGRKGSRKAKELLTSADRRRFGKMGGRPKKSSKK